MTFPLKCTAGRRVGNLGNLIETIRSRDPLQFILIQSRDGGGLVVYPLNPQTKSMKIQSKLTAAVSIAALVVGPLAVAEDAAPAAPEISVCELPVDVTTCFDLTDQSEEVVDNGEVVDAGDNGTDAEVTTVEDDSVTCGEGVPIDWVKRGGGADGEAENPEIYYNMAGGPAPVLEGGTSNALARELGQDDKAAAIETKANTSVPQIMSEKKEPVALIKNGRVFLR